MKVLSFGEIIWDIYPDKKCIGGAPLNFSAHVAKNGAESYLLSCVGQDDLGKQAKEYLAKFGVKNDFVFECDEQTGACCSILIYNCIIWYQEGDFCSPPYAII